MSDNAQKPYYRKNGIEIVGQILVLSPAVGLAKITEVLSGSAAVGNEVFIPKGTRDLLLGEVKGPWRKDDSIVLVIKPSDNPEDGKAKWVAVEADAKHAKSNMVQRPSVGQAADSLIANSRPIFSQRIRKVVEQAVDAGLTKQEIQEDQTVIRALEEIRTALESRADDRIVVANEAFARLKHRLNQWVALRRSADLDAADADLIGTLLEEPTLAEVATE